MVFRFSSMYRALESGQAQRLLQPGQGGAGTAERVSLPKLHQKVNHDFLKQNVSFSVGVGALFGGGILNSHQGVFFYPTSRQGYRWNHLKVKKHFGYSSTRSNRFGRKISKIRRYSRERTGANFANFHQKFKKLGEILQQKNTAAALFNPYFISATWFKTFISVVEITQKSAIINFDF